MSFREAVIAGSVALDNALVSVDPYLSALTKHRPKIIVFAFYSL
jgi:hypothetical protein